MTSTIAGRIEQARHSDLYLLRQTAPDELLLRWRVDRAWTPGRAAQRFEARVVDYVAWERGCVIPRHIVAKVSSDLDLAPLPLADLPRTEVVVPEECLPGDLGRMLGMWRAAQEISLRRVARWVGVSPGAVAHWQRGGVPRPLHLPALAAALGVAVRDVRQCAGDDPVCRPQSSGGPRATPLAQARLDVGLTQREIARRVCVSVSTVSRWEAGERRPSFEDAHRLAAALYLTVHDVEDCLDGYPTSCRDTVGKLPALSAALVSRGLSVEALAEALDVTDAAAQDLAAGRRAFPRAGLPALSELLGQDPLDCVSTLRRGPTGATESALREIRRRRGMTQKDVGRRIGVCASTVSVWERSIRTPERFRAVALARVLDAPWEDLAKELGHVANLPRPEDQADLPFGILLFVTRSGTGFSATQLGRMIGASGGTVRRWENQIGLPRRRYLPRLAVALGLDETALRQRWMTGCQGRATFTDVVAVGHDSTARRPVPIGST